MAVSRRMTAWRLESLPPIRACSYRRCHKGVSKTERMHDLVIGLYINRYEFGRPICTMINTFATSSGTAWHGMTSSAELVIALEGTQEILRRLRQEPHHPAMP
jgi:hypothetical protein